MTLRGHKQIKHVPNDVTRRAVTAMVITGVPQTRIAAALQLGTETLKKHYRAELDEAMDKANTQVVSESFPDCDGKNPAGHGGGRVLVQDQNGLA